MTDALSRLRAGLDRDEAIARAAIRTELFRAQPDDGVWEWNSDFPPAEVGGWGIQIYDEGGHTPEQARHIAENDPSRVLRQVAAIRKVIAEHEPADGRHCDVCRDYDFHRSYDPVDWPCPTILTLAEIYPEDTTETES